MTALTTADYFDEMEHLKILDDIFNDAVKEKISEVVGLKIFDEKTKQRRNTTYEVGVGLTGVTAIAEGANYPEASGEEPNTLSLRKSKYGANVVVTEEMKIFDEYDQLEDRVRSIVDDALDKLDTTLAEILINGFATTTYTNALGTSITPIGQEARALFNATDGNIITMPDGTAHPKLANTSVSAIRVQGAKHKNVLGQSKPIRYDYLLVWPALEDKGRRILESDTLTNNRDINPNKGKMKLVVWDRLAVDDNSTDKYWFSFNKIKVKRQLKFEWAVQPVLMEAQILPSNGNIVRRFRMLFSSGFLNFPYIAGSMGINDVEEEGVPVTIENTADNPVPMIDATP